MHYCCEIWISSIDCIEQEIEEILKPYDLNIDDENYLEFIQSEDCINCSNLKDKSCIDGNMCDYYRNDKNIIGYNQNLNGFYDWYQIGGRYSGHKIKDYNPELDIRNWKKCYTCNGTGYRFDDICNVCGKWNKYLHKYEGWKISKGITLEWPGWNNLDVNILSVSNIISNIHEVFCYRVIYKDINIKKGSNFNGNLKKFIKEYNIKNGYFVTIDYHN